jgi:hypothetical protein
LGAVHALPCNPQHVPSTQAKPAAQSRFVMHRPPCNEGSQVVPVQKPEQQSALSVQGPPAGTHAPLHSPVSSQTCPGGQQVTPSVVGHSRERSPPHSPPQTSSHCFRRVFPGSCGTASLQNSWHVFFGLGSIFSAGFQPGLVSELRTSSRQPSPSDASTAPAAVPPSRRSASRRDIPPAKSLANTSNRLSMALSLTEPPLTRPRAFRSTSTAEPGRRYSQRPCQPTEFFSCSIAKARQYSCRSSSRRGSRTALPGPGTDTCR